MTIRKAVLVLCLALIPCLPLLGQGKLSPEKLAPLGKVKVIDGSMDEWSPLGAGGHGTAANEYYFYDTGANFWKDPQGGYDDEPLSMLALNDHPVSGNPEPVASGFNLWGMYLCYEHFHHDHSVILALDLPLSSNKHVSYDYIHPYNSLPPTQLQFYPVAFDADGNGDPVTCNSTEYNPSGYYGFNFVKSGVKDDGLLPEFYIIDLFLGDDDFPSKSSDNPFSTGGLHIQISLTSTSGVIEVPAAIIPGMQTKTGNHLDLVATYGPDILEVGGHDNPDPFSYPRIVDIEIRLNRLSAIIEDDSYIDWTKVSVGKVHLDDLRKIFVKVMSGTLEDLSSEHMVQGGVVFPEQGFTFQKSKKF